MPDRVGQQLGNYRLVKLLGKGGFAEVYLGQHVHLAAKQAAIKLLHLIDVDARKFQEEAETTEKLVHPHIVRLLDFAIEYGTPFLVLDYAPGGSLRTRYPKGSVVPLAQVEAYLKEIAPALQYAHDQHILHRDIKPDNVLIGRGGELLISDFGIAVLTQTGRTSLSSAYRIGGTPYYMAPETYQGRPVKESDQYALAVMVYEWLCGSVPFSEGNFIQLGFQHSHEPVPPLREKNPAIAIPPQVEAVILKALAKEPKERFASVQTFVQAFEQSCIQEQQAEEERLQAEEKERTRQAEEERLRQATSQTPPVSQPSSTLSKPVLDVIPSAGAQEQIRPISPTNRLKPGLIYGVISSVLSVLILIGTQALNQPRIFLVTPLWVVLSIVILSIVAGLLPSRASGSLTSAGIAGGILGLSLFLTDVIDVLVTQQNIRGDYPVGGSLAGWFVLLVVPVFIISVLFGLLGRYLHKRSQISL